MQKRIAALYVLEDGPYADLAFIDLWDETRDARGYKGPYPVIAHPPCKRWGRYWSGGPMFAKTDKAKCLGDDEGCFAQALWAVRTFGGIIEHPEASHAWTWFGLRKPPQGGGWVRADGYEGFTCCVAQGNYGHRAQKLTWLYANGLATSLFSLKWGLTPGKNRLEDGFHSKEERRRLIRTRISQRLSHRQRELTPLPFRDLLVKMAESILMFR